MATTLTSTEILQDVIMAFKKKFPLIFRFSHQFTPQSLKLGKQYIAHVSSVPSVEDVTTTYAITGQTARSLLTDINVTVDTRKAVLLKWSHLSLIQDDKLAYAQAIDNAGYALAKSFVDSLLLKARTSNFSQSVTAATSDFDVDVLNLGTGQMNTQGAAHNGRTLIIPTSSANILAVDSRIASRDYYAQMGNGEGYRTWYNAWGWEQIIEYPDFPTNTALTAVTAANTGDVFTKAAHGLSTGDKVTAASFSAGFSDGTYYVIRLTSSTFQLASSRANAVAATAVAVTADGTGGVVTLAENLSGFGFDPRAITFLAGIPDGFDMQPLQDQLGIPKNMAFESVSMEGITMGAASWQDVGTGDLNWAPTLTWGITAGAAGAAPGSGTDYAGLRFITA